MRLIDVDKIYQILDNKSSYGYVSALDISSIEIVDAIPVEWIEERLKKALSFTHSEAEGKIVYDGCVITMVSASFTAQVLSNLLEDWEEENDKMS